MTQSRRAALGAALVVSLASSAATAQEWPLNPFAVSPDEEIQDLLFLGDARPILIRLRIRVDGEGHRGRWQEFVRRVHSGADAGRDGLITRSEATKAVDRVHQLKASATLSGRGLPRRQVQVMPEVVTVTDLADQMRPVVPPFQVERQAPTGPTGDEDTFRLLDRDDDGFLTRGELESAGAALARLDIDDDEILAAEELGPYRGPGLAYGVVRTPPGANANPAQGLLLVSASEQEPRDLARLIIERYHPSRPPPASPARFAAAARGGRLAPPPPGRDLVLRAGELRIDREAFARLDSNRDDAIDAAELERAVADAFDLELVVRLGRREPGRPAIGRLDNPGKPEPFGAPKVGRVGDLILIHLDSTVIEVGIGADATEASAATRAAFESRFRAADVDRDGSLGRDEVRKFLPLSSVFGLADRDGDGRLTEAEWRGHLDDQAEVLGLRMVLQAVEQGPSFLDLLDANRDRKLGPRELRAAAGRILLQDRDGDDRVSLAEFAKHHRWTIARGQATPPLQPPIVPDRPPADRQGGPGAMPEWFLKMDRNRDGDVSPREFLGTRTTFEGLDLDRDGLISPPEAARPR